MAERNLNKQEVDLSKRTSREDAAKALQLEILKLEVKAQGLEKDNAALIAEYVNATDEEAPEKVKKNIRARMPAALQLLDILMATGSDAIKANLLKWVIDRGLAPDSLGGVDSATQELNKLLSQLKPEDSKTG